MATPNPTSPTTLKVPAAAPFADLPCLKCGEAGGLTLSLTDLETVYCGECENEYGLADARDAVRHWRRVLAWVDAAPAAEED
jgi:hypothetical protein